MLPKDPLSSWSASLWESKPTLSTALHAFQHMKDKNITRKVLGFFFLCVMCMQSSAHLRNEGLSQWRNLQLTYHAC